MGLFDVVLPEWGMMMEEGIILRWIKKVGDRVNKGEPIAEIETAKANQVLDSAVDGFIEELVMAEGATAKVNAVIARIRTA